MLATGFERFLEVGWRFSRRSRRQRPGGTDPRWNDLVPTWNRSGPRARLMRSAIRPDRPEVMAFDGYVEGVLRRDSTKGDDHRETGEGHKGYKVDTPTRAREGGRRTARIPQTPHLKKGAATPQTRQPYACARGVRPPCRRRGGLTMLFMLLMRPQEGKATATRCTHGTVVPGRGGWAGVCSTTTMGLPSAGIPDVAPIRSNHVCETCYRRRSARRPGCPRCARLASSVDPRQPWGRGVATGRRDDLVCPECPGSGHWGPDRLPNVPGRHVIANHSVVGRSGQFP